MDSFNNGLSSVANTSFRFNDAGGNNENEPNPEMASKFRKQLPTKNFMSPTISAANKAAGPKKKILAERNETLDDVEQTSLSSKGLKFPDDDDVDKSSLRPYDPIRNYLSPRPKFLRYNPNRRRKVFLLQGNEESVKSSNSFDGANGIPSSELELGLGSSGFKDYCSQKESVEEAEDKIDEEGKHEDDEEAEGKNDEEEMDELEEDRGCWFKGFLKCLFAVIAVILTTQAICSMNSPTPSHALESIWSFNGWYNNVHGAACSNFSGVVQDLIREEDLMVGRLKEEVVYHGYEGLSLVETIKESVVVQNAQINDVVSKKVENNETNVTVEEMLSNHEDTDKLQRIGILQEQEIDNVEAEIKVHDQPLREYSEANEKISQLTTDADSEIAKDMENVVEKEIDDRKTNQMLIRSASFDLIVGVLIGLVILVLTSSGVMYHSKRMKSSSPVTTTVAQEKNVTEKEDIKNLDPSPNPSSLIQHLDEEPLLNSASMQIDVSKEISHIHAPSVELLGEFVFGGEVSSSFKSCTTKDYNKSAEADVSNSLIQATTGSSSQMKSFHKEASTGDSHTVKKQRRKTAETSSMVTPSTVRRSSRLQNRSATSP